MLGNLSRHYWCSAEIPLNPFTNFVWPSCGFPALSLWVETMLLFLGKQPQYTRAFLTEQAKNLKSLGGYFPGGSAGKESTCNLGDLDLIPGLGRFPEEGNGYPPQYSGLANFRDCVVLEFTESWTPLSNFHLHPHEGCC